ncbi:PepSY domain-containing protein [Caulobacter sp. 73W]|uniref:PepSY domain-containing protein n=1 Tax=Caulobacter sp. 73W TaxID=3161137 RepID=A0AB39KXR7_9CAUL
MTFKTRNIILAAGAAVLVAGGAVAIAQTAAPAHDGKFSVAAERVEAQGYTILEMDRDRSGFDVEAVASDGRRMELDVDAAGKIVRERLDD